MKRGSERGRERGSERGQWKDWKKNMVSKNVRGDLWVVRRGITALSSKTRKGRVWGCPGGGTVEFITWPIKQIF